MIYRTLKPLHTVVILPKETPRVLPSMPRASARRALLLKGLGATEQYGPAPPLRSCLLLFGRDLRAS